jgi:hypothetical protein
MFCGKYRRAINCSIPALGLFALPPSASPDAAPRPAVEARCPRVRRSRTLRCSPPMRIVMMMR